MGRPVITVASGGRAVVDVTSIAPQMGLRVTESTNGFGLPVTKVAAGKFGMPVMYAAAIGSGPAAVPNTFDGATATNVALSNGNLTATHTNTTAGSGVRVTPALTTGKYYFEMTLVVGNGSQDAFGLLEATTNYLNMLTTNGVAAQRTTGNIYANGGITAKTLGAFVAGNVLGLAVDLTATPRQAWLRKGAGNWNGDATANPATATGGVTVMATVAFSPAVQFSGSGTAANDAVTANFGASAFAGAVPSGFTAGWPA